MNLTITVRRQASPEEAPYLQEFAYTGDGELTVADWLSEQNSGAECRDSAGNPVTPVAFECGCLEKKCGACAMRINGVPMLACSAFLKDTAEKGRILLEPLSKFPLVRDLVVDRAPMFEALRNMKVWTQERNWSDLGWDRALQYEAGQCLMCGCCLEVCPNFLSGGSFAGAAAMLQAYKALEQNLRDAHFQDMAREYGKQFFQGCGQALSCQSVCPMKLRLDEIQARANAHGVWKK